MTERGHGNSRGPLLDSAGRLIGVNTAIASDTGTSIGVGFAVPIDDIVRLVARVGDATKLAAGGKPVRIAGHAFGLVLGRPGLATRFGVEGLVVRSVEEGSPAARAGIIGLGYLDGAPILGDVLVTINGVRAASHEEVVRLVDQLTADQPAVLVLQRDGARREVTLKL